MRKLRLVNEEQLETRLWQCLCRRQLPDALLYVGSEGASNWLALSRTPQFDVAARLTELLRRSAPALARAAPPAAGMLSIGVGDGAKERILLETLAPAIKHYVAADVSEPLLDEALHAVADMDVDAVGVVAFCEDMRLFREQASSPAMICLLGNNFCNYEPLGLLAMLSSVVDSRDTLLFDCHLLPDEPAAFERWQDHVRGAYRSSANVAFNMAPLVRRGMPPSAARFQLDLTTDETSIGRVVRTHKRIYMLADATLELAAGEVRLRAGETLEMGFTCKYRLDQIHALLGRHGFDVLATFADEGSEYAIFLARKTDGGNP